jgi:zinc protease
MGIERFKLENGIEVVVDSYPTIPMIGTFIWYKVGSKNENIGVRGGAHFVEHMLFQESKTFKKGELEKVIDRYGGYWNGMTSHDYTVYFEVLPKDELDLALTIEKQRMTGALFPPDEFNRERTVILSELEGGDNYPQYRLHKEMLATIFRVHPYQWPVIGYREDIESLTRDELYNFYTSYYSPNNALLILSGDVDKRIAKALVTQYFGELKKEAASAKIALKEPPQRGERRVTLRLKGKVPIVAISYLMPSLKEKEFAASLIYNTILGGAKYTWRDVVGKKTSKLYKKLVRKGLASDVDIDFPSAAYSYPVYIYITPTTGISIGKIEKNAIEETEDAMIAEEDVDSAKDKLLSAFAYPQDNILTRSIIRGQLLAAGEINLDELISRIKEVTLEDVKEAQESYFVEDKRTVGLFIPEDEK